MMNNVLFTRQVNCNATPFNVYNGCPMAYVSHFTVVIESVKLSVSPRATVHYQRVHLLRGVTR